MVSIGGLNLNLNFGMLTGIVQAMFWGLMVMLFVGLVAWFFWSKMRNKVVYLTPVTLTLLYDNGTQETKYGFRGAKYIGRQGAWEFKVKVPKQRKTKDIGYLPDFSKADKDGTIHFVTAGDGTYWQQEEWKTIVNETIDGYDENGEIKSTQIQLLKKPIVGSDEKNIMIKDIKNWREVVAKNKVTAFAIGLGMFLIMVIAHLISLYIQTKIRCPTV